MERPKRRRRTSTNREPQTLLHASAYPTCMGNVFGIILDATGHYKTDDSIDYVTRLKIIDHTVNNSKNSRKDNLENFVYVFIYSESVDTAPQIGRIGDVIRLENFEFDSYQRVVKAVFHRKKSSWTIFDGRKNANMKPIISLDESPNQLNEKEQTFLHNIRSWSEKYFGSKSLFSMNWFKRAFPANPDPKKIYQLKDVDVVVKLVAKYSIRVKETFYQKLVFADKLCNLYFGELKGILSGVNVEDVMKLRSVILNLHNKQYKISFSTYSNFMVLQRSFKDSKDILQATKKVKYDSKKLKKQFFEEMHLDKRTMERIGPNSLVYTHVNEESSPINEELVKKNFLNSFPILKNFSFDSADLNKTKPSSGKRSKSKQESKSRGSTILLKHDKLPLTSLKTINQLLSKKSKSKEGDIYRVRVSIKTIENNEFNSNFKIFSKAQNKTWELDTKKRKFDADEKIIFYNVFGMKDGSLGKKDLPVPVYLITYNENPKYIYDLWGQLPDPLSIKDWLQLKKTQKEIFKKSLSQLKNPNKWFDIIVQKVQAGGNRIYLKLVDSMFWFTDSNLSE
jgi:hypothetical protein